MKGRTELLLHGPASLMRAGMRVALLAALACAPAPAYAQAATDTAAQGGYALVLSGGGARGIAHAGALLALDQLGYDIPVVVGTSMGSIIGALYAAGYSAEAIQRITAEEQWIARFVADPLPVGPARTALRPLLEVGLGRRRQQEGLLPAHGVNLRLVELLFDAGARARNDFDRLPRRFRAVAADLTTGRDVALDGFDLPRAVRASMAVPGAFAPVSWPGMVLVDGGIANNLPVSVARSMTALPVIAVDVLLPPSELEEQAPLDVAIRALRLLIENARPDTAAHPDILVRPELAPGFSEMWFPRDPGRLLRTGYEAVHARLPRLGTMAPPPPAPLAAPHAIDAVEVSSSDPALAGFAARLAAPLTGPYDPEEVIARTRALYATNLFQAVWPRLEFRAGDDGPATLVIDATPASRSGVAGAARWDNDTGAGAWIGFRHRVPVRLPLELRASGTFDRRIRRGSVDASMFSTSMPGWIGNAGAHGGRERAGTDMLEVRRVGGWMGLEAQGDWFLSALVRADHVDDATLPPTRRGWAAGPFLRAARAPDPDRVVGLQPVAELEARFGDVSYTRAHLAAAAVVEAGAFTVAPLVDLARSSEDAPRDAFFETTRELAPWLPVGALLAPIRLAAGLDIAHPFVLNGLLRLRVRGIGTGFGPGDLEHRAAWRAGAEIGAAWATVIGPLEAGIARGGGGDWRFNVGVGPAFR